MRKDIVLNHNYSYRIVVEQVYIDLHMELLLSGFTEYDQQNSAIAFVKK